MPQDPRLMPVFSTLRAFLDVFSRHRSRPRIRTGVTPTTREQDRPLPQPQRNTRWRVCPPRQPHTSSGTCRGEWPKQDSNLQQRGLQPRALPLSYSAKWCVGKGFFFLYQYALATHRCAYNVINFIASLSLSTHCSRGLGKALVSPFSSGRPSASPAATVAVRAGIDVIDLPAARTGLQYPTLWLVRVGYAAHRCASMFIVCGRADTRRSVRSASCCIRAADAVCWRSVCRRARSWVSHLERSSSVIEAHSGGRS